MQDIQGMHPKMQVKFSSVFKPAEIIFCLNEVFKLKIHDYKNFSWPLISISEGWKLPMYGFKVSYCFWYAPQNAGLLFLNFLLNKLATIKILLDESFWMNCWYLYNKLIKLCHGVLLIALQNAGLCTPKCRFCLIGFSWKWQILLQQK